MNGEASPKDAADEISELIELLHRTEQRLAELTAGEVDSVASSTGRTYLLQRAQTQLRVDEAQKQTAILDALHANIALLDSEGGIVEVNDGWRAFAGADACPTRNAGPGANYLEVCERAARDGSADAGRAAAGIRAVLGGEVDSFRMEYECSASAGSRWFLMTVTPLPKGKRRWAIVMHTDVSERMRAERETRRTTELVQAVVDGAPDGIYIKDTQGRYLLCNQVVARFVGLSVEEMIGRDATAIPALATSQALSPSERWVMESGAIHTSERRLNTPTGIRHIHTSTAPYRNDAGEVLGVICIARDVSEMHALTANLAAEHTRLVAVQDVAKIGSWTLDLGAGVAEWSVQTHRIFETDPQHFVPTNERVCEIIHPDDRQAVRSALEMSLKLPVANHQLEHRLLLESGVERIVEHRWQVFQDADGAALTAFGTCQDITERKQAERELRTSQWVLSMAGRLAQVGAWWVELPEMKVQWSDTVALIHDMPPGSAPTVEEAVAFYTPDHRPLIEKAFTRCKDHGEPYDVEYEIVTARGRRVHVRAIGEAVRDDNGGIYRVQGALQDLTERREAERQAARLADKLASTLETISDGFFTLDREWRFTYLNREAERLLQHRRESLLGQVTWDVFPEMIDTPFESHCRQAMLGIRGSSGESFFAPWNRWIGLDCYPSDEGLSVYFRDVTAKHATQQRLQLLEACVSQLNEVVVITKVTDAPLQPRRIVFVNDAFVRATGYSRDEAIGQSPAFLDGPLTDQEEVGRLKAALERFEAVHVELVRYRKDGSWYWSEQEITPIGFAGEVYSHYVLVERDISERKRDQDALRELNAELESRVETRTAELNLARLQAEQANLAKSSFLATMSHEIRTPMNGVIGMIDVLEQTNLKRGQVEIVKTVRESAHALLHIVDDVLDFSKIEAGQYQIDHEPMDLEAVMEGVSGTLEHAAAASGVMLQLFTDPAIPSPVYGDPTRLRQVLLNLVGNAVKFSGNSHRLGCVQFRVKLLDRRDDRIEVEFCIADNGIGMDQAMQERLFTPFTQAEGGATRRFGGTGLGLSISQRLTQLMGGAITVSSEPDRGSTFLLRMTMRLPLDRVAAPAIVPAIAGLPCLVIGEEGGTADDLMTYLSSAGASACRVDSAVDGLPWLDRQSGGPCVVVIARAGPTTERTLTVCRRTAAGHPSLRVRFVVIEQGRQLERHLLATDVRTVNGQAMHRGLFLDQVARDDEPPDAIDTDFVRTDALPQDDLPERGQSKGRVLVAEDNEINRTVIRRQLALLGFAVDIATTGGEALEYLQRGAYDILLTDLHMPTMDGYELAAKVREFEAGRSRIPIVALTANAVKGEAKRCRQVGMDDYMTKPVQLTNLRAMLGKWVPAGEPATQPVRSVEPPRAGAKTSGAPADLSELVALVGSDRKVIRSMLQAFRRSAARASSEIAQALIDDDAIRASDAAHMLKAGARSIGAERLCEICTLIEEAVERGQAGALPGLSSRFTCEMDALDRFLDSVQEQDRSDGSNLPEGSSHD